MKSIFKILALLLICSPVAGQVTITLVNPYDLYDTTSRPVKLKPGDHKMNFRITVNRVTEYKTIPVTVVADSNRTGLNYFPIAYAGADTTIKLGVTGNLRGNGYDMDGVIKYWKWVKLSGPTKGKISYSTRQNTTLTGLVAGKYVYQLTVTDDMGGIGRDTVVVTVSGPIVVTPPPPVPAFKTYYVSTSGSGSGTYTSPWGLQPALTSIYPKPGDTVYLRGGVYKGLFTSTLSGTAASPIIVKPYPGERVIIDGTLAGQTYKNKSALTLNGSYAWYIGLEVTNSDPERTIKIAGSNPVERRGGGVDIFGPGIKVINCIIYDVGQGVSWWTPAQNSEVYGNIVFNNGWYAPDREHGHGVYSQNNTGTKTLSSNIIFSNFGYGFHVYGSDQSQLKNFLITDNVLFNDHNLIGGGAPLENIELERNLVYADNLQLGYESRFNTGLKMTGNYFPGGLSLYWWKNVIANDNTIFMGNKYAYPIRILFNGAPDLSTFKFDWNKYYWSYPGPGYPANWGAGWKNTVNDTEGAFLFPEWKQAGQDINAIVRSMPMKNSTEFTLSGKQIFSTRNKYDLNRAHITIYNWDKSATVDIDVDTLLKIGDAYELRNVQNYFGDVITGTYSGKITVTMTGRTVAKPYGYDLEIAPSTFPEFGSFVLIKK